jgi:hypothetical protein
MQTPYIPFVTLVLCVELFLIQLLPASQSLGPHILHPPRQARRLLIRFQLKKIPQIANWLEQYAESLELNVWTSATVDKAVWNERIKTWEVEVLREGEAPRVLNVKHLVFATGFVGGAYIPDLHGKVK